MASYTSKMVASLQMQLPITQASALTYTVHTEVYAVLKTSTYTSAGTVYVSAEACMIGQLHL